MSKQTIAEIPPESANADQWALRLISVSQRNDFKNSNEWAKWSHSVACAGLANDDRKIESLCDTTILKNLAAITKL